MPLADARAADRARDRQGRGHRRPRRHRGRRARAACWCQRRGWTAAAPAAWRARGRRRGSPRPSRSRASCTSGAWRTLPPPMATGFVACSPEAVFPGAGGMPIRDDRDAVVAGIAASGATVGPFVDYPGADRRKLIADGKPANCEDLLVHYALGHPLRGPARRRRAALDRRLRLAARRARARDDRPAAGLRAAGARVGARARRPGDRRGAGARRAHRRRGRRPPRRPDPAGLHGRRADRRPVRRRGGRRQRRRRSSSPAGDVAPALARCSRTAPRPSPGGLPVAEGDRVVGGARRRRARSRYVQRDRRAVAA